MSPIDILFEPDRKEFLFCMRTVGPRINWNQPKLCMNLKTDQVNFFAIKRSGWLVKLTDFSISPFTKGFLPYNKFAPLAEHSSRLVFVYTLYFLLGQVLTVDLCFRHARLVLN